MAKQDTRYTLYLLILVVAIILIIGLLSAGGTIDAGHKTTAQQTATKEIQSDTSVATVAFTILPQETEGGSE